MASKTLNRVLRCSNCNPRTVAAAYRCQRRTFTSSNACRTHGAVPTFANASSPELKDFLSTMRENVFLPSHLSTYHQAIVFGARHRKALRDDPVMVEISGENFQLKHIDRKKDQLGTVDALMKLISLMKDKKDWDNLPIFLEELRNAGRSLKPPYLEKMVRKAGQANQQGTIVECARRASRTGFFLKDVDLVREVMWWTQQKAISAGWTANSTKKALAMAEQITDLMENKNHCGKKFLRASDPRSRPEIVGVLLQLAAAHAKLSGGKDDDGKVALYARRLLGTLKRKANFQGDLVAARELWTSNVLLRNITPIVYGMREAAEILGQASKEASELKEREPALAAILAQEHEKIIAGESAEQSSERLGIENYNKLLGSQ